MNVKVRQRFDIATLRDQAGDKVFARGEAYFRNNQVEILSIEPERVLAEVAGTDDYRTVLTGSGKRIGGECSCPAFEDWGVCKHMVATALAVNAAGVGSISGEGATLSDIRAHLKTMSVDMLVETILEAAERDTALLRKLQRSATLARADDKTLEAHLQREIDAATRTGGGMSYHAVPAWAGVVDETLDAVADLLTVGRNAPVLRLAMHAIDRISAAMSMIDDSDGHCGAMLDRARNIHLAAAIKIRPDPVALARDLFKRELESDETTFDGAMHLYADVLGEKGEAEYRRLATEAWEKLPVLSGGKMSHEGVVMDGYLQLHAILDFFVERDGNLDERIALRRKNLSSTWQYLQLAQFCLTNEREQQALHWAEEGLWMFEDQRPDERLVSFTVDLLSRAGKQADARSLLRRTFEKAPSLHLYQQVTKLGDHATRDEMLKFLENRLADRRGKDWQDSELLVQILMHEKAFDAAWLAVHRYGASGSLKDALAEASEKSHPYEAVRVYAAHVDALANTGGNPAYQRAVLYIERMAALQSNAEHADYLADIKTRFASKRNLMKLLR